MLDAILFPSSFFDRKKIDEVFQREYAAAVECGLFSDVYLFSYEDWFHHGRLTLDHVPEQMITAAHRGWMMLPEQYERFYNSLLESNIRLIPSPEEYNALHIFPNVYPLIREGPGRLYFRPALTLTWRR